VNAVYESAKADAIFEVDKMKIEVEAIREESEALGILKKIDYDITQNEMLKYTVLYRIKESKDYRKGGKTWDEFCESIGEPRRTTDRILNEVAPVIEAFSAKLTNLIGCPLSKIRYLGRTVSANLADFDGNALVFEGQKIPLTPEHKEDIEAVIDTIKETHKKEKEELQAKLKKEAKEKEALSKETIKGLASEKDDLIQANRRLKVFDIGDNDLEWSFEQIEVIEGAAQDFNLLCRKFIIDDRLKDDLHLQAKVQTAMTEAKLAIRDLQRLWDETFNSGYDEAP